MKTKILSFICLLLLLSSTGCNKQENIEMLSSTETLISGAVSQSKSTITSPSEVESSTASSVSSQNNTNGPYISSDTPPKLTRDFDSSQPSTAVKEMVYPPGQFNGMFKRGIPDKLVILTFDDSLRNHYTNVAPELKARGFGGTFYITEINVSVYGAANYSDGVSKKIYMSWKEIAELEAQGFEIGNHSLHHPDLTALKKEAITTEIGGIEAKCLSNRIAKPVTFAYPGLFYSDEVISCLTAKGYLFARTGLNDVYDPTLQSPLKIMGTDGPLEYNEFTRKADKARDGKIVVFIYHDVPDKMVFSETMDYLKSNNFTVISLKQLSDYIDPEKAVQYFNSKTD